MKKTIALFMVAALISVGLIASCSDDPAPPKPETVKYIVAFDANGGELEAGTSIAVTVEEGEAVGDAKWPEDPVKTTVFDYGIIEDDFNGWYDGDVQYTSKTKITKDVTLVAKYTPFVRPERSEKYYKALGWFTWENNPTTQRGWRANGADNVVTDLAWEDITDARYLVLHTKGGTGKDWKEGFGGIQIVMQGDGAGWGWDQTNINNFYIPRSETSDVYIAIDLTTLKSYSKIVKGSIGKFLISYYDGLTNSAGLGLQEAYLTNIDLEPKSSVSLASNQNKITGFATGDDVLKLLGITPSTNTKTVTFKYNYGTEADVEITVETGKGLGLKYLDIERPGHDFLGWFDDSSAKTITVADQEADDFDLDAVVEAWGNKYVPTKAVEADVTLYAGWKQQNWPDIKNAEKQDSNVSEWSINGKFPFKYFIIASVGGGNADGYGGIQFGIQGGGVSQAVRSTGDWTSLSHTAKDIVYFIIDLTQYDVFDEPLFNATWAQFRINYGGNNLGNYQGYIVDNSVTSLTKPADAGDFGASGNKPDSPDGDGFLTGYVTKTLPAELKN